MLSKQLFSYGNTINIWDYLKKNDPVVNHHLPAIGLKKAKQMNRLNATQPLEMKSVPAGPVNFKSLKWRRGESLDKTGYDPRWNLNLRSNFHSPKTPQIKQRILVPSFGTCTPIFIRHLKILDNLKSKIDEIKEKTNWVQRSKAIHLYVFHFFNHMFVPTYLL